jgi:putative inorganic carbon (hco3(-)) transporter
MAELAAIARRWQFTGRGADLLWTLTLGAVPALSVAVALTYSVQAACALVLVALVVAVYLHDRRAGVVALFAFWFLAPWLRRLFDLMTGYVNTDPLSLAPFLATAAAAGLELTRVALPPRVRRILLAAAAGFSLGFPVGLAHPSAAVYAFVAYIAGLAGAILGFADGSRATKSALRTVLLLGMLPIALYAVLQRALPLSAWDRSWIDATGITSIGTASNGSIRVFSTLNAPGALAPLLGLALLCYLTVRGHRGLVVLATALLGVALALTYVRSAWIALLVAGLAHVVATGGRSAGKVLGFAAMSAILALALSPVSPAAHDAVTRFETIGSPGSDTSATDRRATLGQTLPKAMAAPAGHGLGSAGEPTKLTGDTTLRAPDNGYLALLYQVGPVGFVLVMSSAALMLRAAWDGARARAPGQELRTLFFSMFVFLLVSLASGDQFYGSLGVIFWFLGGRALAFEHSQRARAAIASA